MPEDTEESKEVAQETNQEGQSSQPPSKNAHKRARQFDFSSLVKESIEEAKIRASDGKLLAGESEIIQETSKIILQDIGSSTPGTSNVGFGLLCIA
jgi:hypothetical protein